MSGDRGAKALAERLTKVYSPAVVSKNTAYPDAAFLIGAHGLFVEDVREHEPELKFVMWQDGWQVCCRCGWEPGDSARADETFFDHIGTQP